MITHNLLATLDPATDEYQSISESVKFDLGEHAVLSQISQTSAHNFCELPAPVCLFQIEFNDTQQIYLARRIEGAILWRGWSCRAGLWEQCAFQVRLSSSLLAVRGCEIKRLDGSEIEDQEDVPASGRIFASCCISLADAIEVFSCSNIERVEHAPPKFINRKRVAKGKAPFFSYYTLHINPSAQSRKTAQHGGSHASPRLHLRRGHIRKLGERRVWVSASMVGDKSQGFVAKEYLVRG